MSFSVRPAVQEDLDELRRLRQERQSVYLRLAGADEAGDLHQWAERLALWMQHEDAAVMVAARGEQLIGYMIAWQRENLPLLQPARYALVLEMSVDGHCKQGGVGTALLDALKAWAQGRGLAHLEIQVPRRQPIEQAFWRALGAGAVVDQMYMELD